MSVIETRKNSDGTLSYRVKIRKKDVEIYKTFITHEDAELYAFYKERLIDNMKNFDVPSKCRVTLKQIVEMKIQNLSQVNKKTLEDFTTGLNHISKFLEVNTFVSQITYEDWLNCAKSLINSDVYRGSKNESAKRKMAPATLKRILCTASSAITYAQSQGIEIENHPILIIRNYVLPLMKEKKDKE